MKYTMTENLVRKALAAANVKFRDLNGGGNHWFGHDEAGDWFQIHRGETQVHIFLKRQTYKDSLRVLPQYEGTSYVYPISIFIEKLK